MGKECPCGASVGTRAHWCEWRQAVHARRVERLLFLIVEVMVRDEPDGSAEVYTDQAYLIMAEEQTG